MVLISSFTASSAVLSFLFTFALILNIGVGESLDLYFLFLTIPQTLVGVFAAPISSFILPALCNVSDAQLKLMQQWAYVGINFAVSVVLTLGVIFFGFLYDLYIGMDEEYLFLMFCLSIPSYFLHHSLLNVYYSNEEFVEFEFINFLSLLLPLGLLFSMSDIEIEIVPLLLMLRNILCFIVFIFMNNFTRPSASEIQTVLSIVKSSRRLVASFSLTKLQPLIERSVLVGFGSGVLSLFYVSQQVYTLIIQIVNKGYTATIVPQLSREIYNKSKNVKHLLVDTSIKAFLGAFILSASAIVLFKIVVELGVSVQNVTTENFSMLFTFSLLLFIPSVLNLLKDFLYTAFYAMHNSIVPFRVELAGLLIFGSAKLFLFFGGSLWVFLLILSAESIAKYLWAIWAGFYVFSKDSLGSVGPTK